MRFGWVFVFMLVFCFFWGGLCLSAATGDEAEEASPDSGAASVEINEPTKEKKEEGAARVEFASTVHDFGTIPPKSNNICEFRFRNAGDSVLKIGKIRTTCGCTVARLDKKDYEPGASGSIKIKYRAGSRPHAVSKRIYVPTNDSENKKAALTIKARIIKKVEFNPKNIKLYPRKENAGCPKITISSIDGKSFSIKGYKSTGNYLKVDTDSAVQATKFILQPSVEPNNLKAGMNGVLEFTLTHPDCKKVSIPFTVTPEYTITPPSLLILKAETGKTENKTVWVLNNYDEGFEIESAWSEKGIVKIAEHKKVLNNEKKASRHKFELEITPPDEGKFRSRRFRDKFYVKIKGGKRLEVRCNGFLFPKRSKEILEQALENRKKKQSKKPVKEH